MNQDEVTGCPTTAAAPTVTYNGLTFVPFISRKEINARVKEIAAEISGRFEGRCPLLVCVLNGAFLFAADIFRELTIDAEITFIRLKSYDGMSSTGKVKQIHGLSEDIAGRDVIIVEDIIDTGHTMAGLLDDLRARHPHTISIATLLFKPDSLQTQISPDYVGFNIPTKFIIGYGLDLDGLARNLPDIWMIGEQAEQSTTPNKTMRNVVIFGAPGSGKGTQSERIINRYGFHHISTGDVLRSHIKRGTELGAIADGYISKGQLIPDELMVKILADVLDNEVAPEAAGVIFDGFPRTVPQAEALERMLSERGRKVDVVVGLETDDDELTQRLLKRGQESGRSDDNIETIRKRLDVYHNQTSPLRDYYDARGSYRRIEGKGHPDSIFEDIAKHIDAIL